MPGRKEREVLIPVPPDPPIARHKLINTSGLAYAFLILAAVVFWPRSGVIVGAHAQSTQHSSFPGFLFVDNEQSEKTHISLVTVNCERAPSLDNDDGLFRFAMKYVNEPNRGHKIDSQIMRLTQSKPSTTFDISSLAMGEFADLIYGLSCYEHLPNEADFRRQPACVLLAHLPNYEAFVFRFRYTDIQDGDERGLRPSFNTVVLLIAEVEPPKYLSWPTQPVTIPQSAECQKQTLELSKFAGDPQRGGKLVRIENVCGSYLTSHFWTKWTQMHCPNHGIFTMGWTSQSAFRGFGAVQLTVPISDQTPPEIHIPVSEVCIVNNAKKTVNFGSIKACPARFVDAWIRQKVATDNCDSPEELDVEFVKRWTCSPVTPALLTNCFANVKTSFRLKNPELEKKMDTPSGSFRHGDEMCDYVTEDVYSIQYGAKVSDLCGHKSKDTAIVTLTFVGQQEACKGGSIIVPFDSFYMIDTS